MAIMAKVQDHRGEIMRIIIAFICGLWALAAAPAFAETPYLAAFQSGATATYDSKDDAKAYGREVSFTYPKSWSISEGTQTHTVQLIQTPGEFEALCTLSIVPNDDIHDGSLERSLSSPSDIQNFVPEGAKLKSSQATTLDGNTAEEMVFFQPVGTSGKHHGHAVAVFTAYEKTLVSFQCMAMGATPEAAEAQYDRYQPLFHAIIASIVLNDVRATKAADKIRRAVTPQERKVGRAVLLTAFLAFVLGLIPALITRHVVFRRPAPHAVAWVIAAATSAIAAWLANMAGISTGAGTGLAWWIPVFLISGWVMVGGKAKTKRK